MNWDVTEAEITRLYRYCLRLSHCPWTAEDLVQETLMKVIIIKRSQPERTLTFSFLCTVAKNLFIDEKRRQRDVIPFEEAFHGKVDKSLMYDGLVESLLSTLPIKQAMLITLKDVFQFTSKEIASMLRTSDESIKTALHRARNKRKTVSIEDITSNATQLELISALSKAIQEGKPRQIFLYYRQLETRHFQVRRIAGASVCHVIDPDGNILELHFHS